jgi:hypothetical protein
MATDGATLLWKAIQHGDVAAVQRIVRASPELANATRGFGFTPLMEAASGMNRTVENDQDNLGGEC